jgi:hypothetical protein
MPAVPAHVARPLERVVDPRERGPTPAVVRIVLVGSDGRSYQSTRIYHACTTRRRRG